MSESWENEQREHALTAYFDNELGPEERTHVEQLLENNPDEAELLRRWAENRDTIRELPRYSLDGGFAGRVMAAIEKSSHQHASNEQVVTVTNRAGLDSETNTWRIGLAVIAALAAMLMLTLFVFPAMHESNLAEHQPVISGTGEVLGPEVSPGSMAPNNDVPSAKRQPVIGSLNRSLPGDKNTGRPVDPLAWNSITGPSVEQVLWIENKPLAELEAILASHSIRLVVPDGDAQDQVHLVPQSTAGVEALYVVSTVARMKRAISEMSSESDCLVKVFPLPGGLAGSAIMLPEKAGRENGAAQQIKPLDLTPKGEDSTEIANVDKWFGLVADDDESRIIEFLLLINTSQEAATRVPADSLKPASSDR